MGRLRFVLTWKPKRCPRFADEASSARLSNPSGAGTYRRRRSIARVSGFIMGHGSSVIGPETESRTGSRKADGPLTLVSRSVRATRQGLTTANVRVNHPRRPWPVEDGWPTFRVERP